MKDQCSKKHKSFDRKHRHPLFVGPVVLLLLDKSPSFGYDLMMQIKKFELHKGYHIKPGVIYPALNHLEQEGLVGSKWDTKKGRVPKRVYSITLSGKKAMREWFVFLKKKREMLDKIIRQYEKQLRKK